MKSNYENVMNYFFLVGYIKVVTLFYISTQWYIFLLAVKSCPFVHNYMISPFIFLR